MTVSCVLKCWSQKSHHPTVCCPKSHLQSDLCRKSAIAGRRILSDPVVCEFLVVESYHQGSRIEMVYYPTQPPLGTQTQTMYWPSIQTVRNMFTKIYLDLVPLILQKERKTNQCLPYIRWLVFRQSINHQLIFPWNIVLYVWISQICHLLFEGEWINLLHWSRPGRQAFC